MYRRTMLRLILRPLLISIWLICAVIIAVLFVSRSFGSTTALIFIGQSRITGRALDYYDPNFNLLVSSPDHSGLLDWATSDDNDDNIHENTYVAPRSTQTGVDLFLVSTNNQILRQLTHIQDFPPLAHPNIRDNGDPQWSPDGRWIAFVSTASQSERDVFVIRPDGSGLREVGNALGTLEPLVRWGSVPQANFAIAPFFMLIFTLGIFVLFYHNPLPYIANFGNRLGLSG